MLDVLEVVNYFLLFIGNFKAHEVLCLRNENNITLTLLLQDADVLLV